MNRLGQLAVRVLPALLLLSYAQIAPSAESRTSWPTPQRTAGAHDLPVPIAYTHPKGNLGGDPETTPDGQSPVYFFAEVYEWVNATFVSGDFTQSAPALGIDYHSIANVVAKSYNGLDSVMVGWIVMSPDPVPQLFVYHFVGGEPTCYNGCGYVQLSKTRVPGMHVETTETPQTYAISYSGGDWYVGYQGEWIGYFPGSEWPSGFSNIDDVQWYGEVAAANRFPCAGMGSGAFGDQAGAASVSNLIVDGVAASVQPGTVTLPMAYSTADVTSSSFRYGGPGLCYDDEYIFYNEFNYLQ